MVTAATAASYTDIEAIAAAYLGRKVLVSGHTGFKGGWLATWLARLGAQVVGVSLPPDQGPDNLFERAAVAACCESHFLDVRDAAAMAEIVADTAPSIIFHLAAQPLVHRGYREPLLTFDTNIMGAANVLEAARHTASVKAFVFVTSDKVYDNNEWVWAYRENDRLGGLDPYSASKGAAEIIARTYMTVLRGEGDGYRLATGRGGNVVGGGDWSADRIIPDIVRALRAGKPLIMRNPGATRPWQHVLELCAGYLTLGTRLLGGWPERQVEASRFVGSFNFGPERSNEMPVSRLAAVALDAWGKPGHPIERGVSSLHEATYLRVDSSKSQAELGWMPRLDFEETIRWTMDWYRQYDADPASAARLVDEQITAYSLLLEGKPK